MPTIKLILIDDKDTIERVSDAAQQHFIYQVDYLLVVCSDNKFVKKAYRTRGEKYSRQQAGAFIQNFLLKITEAGLATCWVGAFSDREIKEILNIPENIEIEAIFPIGYELGKAKKRLKPDLESMLYFNKWKNTKMKGPTLTRP